MGKRGGVLAERLSEAFQKQEGLNLSLNGEDG